MYNSINLSQQKDLPFLITHQIMEHLFKKYDTSRDNNVQKKELYQALAEQYFA